ncbi:MAG: SEC-C domain-containing protein [Fimbriimonadales bacterium]|nr:SEC-C domain-containing protein [Fimbriimonadales bacterium]
MRIDKFFRDLFDKSGDECKRLWPTVEKINALEPTFQDLTLEQLAAKTPEFKERLGRGETLDDILPEAFATVREVSKRLLHMRHFDVQLLGGIILHEGKIAEMKTGEGKTLVATLPLYLNALAGRGSHLVTVNDYLARRDAVWMGPIYHHLGLSVGIIQGQSPESDELGGSYLYLPGAQHHDPRYANLVEASRRDAYMADITYGTNHEFGFDYLRDNMVFQQDQLVMRDLYYAIVDEVDSILVDEARTPHIISGASSEDVSIYNRISEVVKKLRPGDREDKEAHYAVDKKNHNASLTEKGYDEVERLLGIDNLAEHPDLMHYVNAAIKAYGLFEKDVEYVVKDNEVVLVDENTGRLMYGRRMGEGLHQALEAKEGVPVQRESQTVAVITFQNLFRLYEKLGGMTGTAKTEEDEFAKIYGLEVVVVPTHREMIRVDHPDVVFKTEEAKFRAIAREILRLYTKQQPVLVGTRSIEMSERVSARLTADKLQLLVLAERVLDFCSNEKGADKKTKAEAMELISTPIKDAKMKAFQEAARKLNLPTDPLGDELKTWFLDHFKLDSACLPNLDEALRHGIPHNVLNAKYHEKEALIIAEAGRKGQVTIATNMAGRGVDILLGGRIKTQEVDAAEKTDVSFSSETFASHRRGGKERAAPPLPLDDQERAALADEVRALGGLFILGTERHESRRIDNQLRGRAGRQGDPGESRYFVSLEDQLWKIFNPKMLENPLLRAWPDFEEVNAKFLSSMIEKTQKRIELHFFEYRKHVLEYDDVLNAQREHIYSDRREYLLGKPARPTIKQYISETLAEIIDLYAPDGTERTKWDYEGIFRDVMRIFPVMDYGSAEDLNLKGGAEAIQKQLEEWAEQAYQKRIEQFGEENFENLERILLLQAITQKWTEHLQSIERLREGIGLRGYGQVDPLIAFRKESHTIFEETLRGIREFVVMHLFHAVIQQQQQQPSGPPPPKMQRVEGEALAAVTQPNGSNGAPDFTKAKRNDPCPCGSGKKFKNCHYREVYC